MATKRKTGLRAEEQGLTPPGNDLLTEDFSGDDVLIDDLAEAGEVPQVDAPEIPIDSLPEVAVDVRTDGFFALKWHGKRDWPIGLRLGTAIPREAVRGVSGELTSDEDGLIAWFQMLPGEVNFRDGTRVVLRYQLRDGYVVDAK